MQNASNLMSKVNLGWKMWQTNYLASVGQFVLPLEQQNLDITNEILGAFSLNAESAKSFVFRQVRLRLRH